MSANVSNSMTNMDYQPVPLMSGQGTTPQQFRAVMRRFAGAVCAISTSDATGKRGLTVTAVCSVCAEPPTLLVVVNSSSRTCPYIRQNGHFSVNVLSQGQEDVAALLATTTDDPFDHIPHQTGAAGAIMIDGALCQFHCRVVSEFPVGTHTIFIGQILHGQAQDCAPLLYHDGAYCSIV